MRVLLQRVASAGVRVQGDGIASIGRGLLLLVGATHDDGEQDITLLAQKIVKLRIFPDDDGVMNRSLRDVGGELLAVSQFTLFASVRGGNRPSWSRAAPGPVSQPLFDRFVAALAAEAGRPVQTGRFGADMQVESVNDGPVTLWLDSRALE